MLEFDANGAVGTIKLRSKGDELAATRSSGDNGGPVDVKRTAAWVGDAKGKS